MNWIYENWKFLVGNILVPIICAILGFFGGKTCEKKKNIKSKASIKGNDNTVNQNNNISL